MRAIAGMLFLLLAGCTTVRETQPARTATEELLISTAAERAASQMVAQFAPGAKVFVDASYVEGLDTKYTTSAMRDQLARDGAHLVDDRKTADVVVELRSGAASIDESSFLIGIPSFNVPIPLTGAFTFPEIALYKKAQQIGTSKVAMTAYEQKDGTYKFTVGPDLGLSNKTQWTLLLFISWGRNDIGQ